MAAGASAVIRTGVTPAARGPGGTYAIAALGQSQRADALAESGAHDDPVEVALQHAAEGYAVSR